MSTTCTRGRHVADRVSTRAMIRRALRLGRAGRYAAPPAAPVRGEAETVPLSVLPTEPLRASVSAR